MKVIIFILFCIPVVIFIVAFRRMRYNGKTTGRKNDSFSSYIEEGEPDDDEINSVEFFDIDE